MERRLAAILAADVVGYSRLIGADEAGTLTLLSALLKDVVRPTLNRHRGRIVKLMGDGLLAEFASVVDAVRAAIEIQEALPERSAHLADDSRIALRIGVNIGDVAVEDGDLFGDGVNVAARLQEIADPNGVAISDDAYRQLSGRLDLPFVDVGEKALKNIKQPMRTWLWSQANRSGEEARPEEPPALPDKPSIAVLPFDNMSGDPEQEFFSDGITEDIITALSKVRWLFVIARNSSFTYKGRAVDVKRVSQELGVRYVLEGSIRKAGDRVRITAQLIDATNGNHVWAERYDRGVEDVFALQDEMTETIISAIEPELGNVERARLLRRAPESLDAWESHQRGMWHVWQATLEDLDKAKVLFERALELTPNYAPALAGLAYAQYLRVGLGIIDDEGGARDEAISEGLEFGRRAILADDRDYFSYLALARVLTVAGAFDEAIDNARFALALNPNAVHCHHALGVALMSAGQPEASIQEFETALRLSPLEPHRWATKIALGRAHYFLQQYDLAEEWARKSLQDHSKNVLGYTTLAAALAEQGRCAEAREALAALETIHPGYTAKAATSAFPNKNLAYTKQLVDGLIKAGMPED